MHQLTDVCLFQFPTVGCQAVQDVVTAAYVYKRAVESGKGVVVPM